MNYYGSLGKQTKTFKEKSNDNPSVYAGLTDKSEKSAYLTQSHLTKSTLYRTMYML